MRNDKLDGSSGAGFRTGGSQGSLDPADHLSGQNYANGSHNKEQSSLEASPHNLQSSAYNRQNNNQLNNNSGNPAVEMNSGLNRYTPFILALTALLIALTAFLMVLRDFPQRDKKDSASSNTPSNAPSNDVSDETASNQNGGGKEVSSPEGYSDGGEETVTLILAQQDAFLSSLEQGAKDAAEELGVNLITKDACQDKTRQIQYIQAAAADGQKAVIVNPVDPGDCSSIVDAAGSMKVVFVNRIPDDVSVLNEDTVFVGSDDRTAGMIQGTFLADFYKAKGQTDIKYIMLRGTEGMSATTLRSEYVLQALADNGIYAAEIDAWDCHYDRTEAMNRMSEFLVVNREFDCIICNNDSMALGAIEACLQSGRWIDFPIVSIDASFDGRQAIKDDVLAMSVFQDAEGEGSGAVAAALNLINGDALNTNTIYEVDESGFILWVPFEEVTLENVMEYDDRDY